MTLNQSYTHNYKFHCVGCGQFKIPCCWFQADDYSGTIDYNEEVSAETHLMLCHQCCEYGKMTEEKLRFPYLQPGLGMSEGL